MHPADQRLLLRLRAIESALNLALAEAAGEQMGYILVVVPAGRIGEHVVATNIEKMPTVVRFLRDAADIVRRRWVDAQKRAEQTISRALN